MTGTDSSEPNPQTTPRELPAGTRILIADDSRVACVVVEDVLEKAGCETSCVTSIPKMLPVVNQFAPDLIIISSWMSTGDSLDIIRKLSHDPATENIPVIATLTRDSNRVVDEIWASGVKDIMFKPLHAVEIMARVSRCLEPATKTKRRESVSIANDAAAIKQVNEKFVTVVTSLKKQVRENVSTEIRQPLEAIVEFMQNDAARHTGNDMRSVQEVFRKIVSAARNLVATADRIEPQLPDDTEWFHHPPELPSAPMSLRFESRAKETGSTSNEQCRA